MTIERDDPETEARIRAARAREGEEHGAFDVGFWTVGEALDANATKSPYKALLVYYDEKGERAEWSYGGIRSRLERAATVLSEEFGVARGDRVATILFNQPEAAIFYLGAMALGATVVPINPEEAEDRVRFVLDHANAKLVVADFEAIEKAVACAGNRGIVRCGGEKEAPGFHLGTILEDGPIILPGEPVEANDEALLIYTSGTTGVPKGVVLTHYNLLADAVGIARWHGIGADDRMMCVLPLHHVNGTVVTWITPIVANASVVLNRKFSASAFWERAAKEKVAIASVVPTILHFLAERRDDLGRHDLRGFRHFICGAGPLTVQLAARFEETFGFPIVHGYGLSETTCYSCFLPADLAQAEHRTWMREHGFPSIGAPIEPNEMAIHDEGGRSLPAWTRGEIVVRGHNVMQGYFRNPEANRAAFTHGWFRSGDEGFWLEGPGGRPFFFITGRIKELIARGGVKFSPLEIDEVLQRLPGVRHGVAVGFENDAYGEEVGAFVEVEEGAKLTEAEVLAHCEKHLPFAKRPKVVRFGKGVPFTSTGKIQRGELRSLFEAHRSVQFREEK